MDKVGKMKFYLIKFSHYLFTVDSQTAKVREPNLPKNQISVDFRFIDIISIQKKPVISYKPTSKLVLFQTGDFLPIRQFT